MGGQGWNMEAQNDMTPDMCLSFCSGSQYAGLEYSRECWCSPYISALSDKLSDQECNMACEGDASKVCGGRLTLTVYNLTLTTQNKAIGLTRSTGLAMVALGLAMAMVVFL